jgi:fucose 4-O-acetylase-like acetyltransferase
MLTAVASFYAVMTATILAYFVATPRYLADFAPALCLLALGGLLGVESWAQRARWTRVVSPLLAILCLVTFVAGVLMSFDYHGRSTSPRWANVEQFVNSMIGQKKSD